MSITKTREFFSLPNVHYANINDNEYYKVKRKNNALTVVWSDNIRLLSLALCRNLTQRKGEYGGFRNKVMQGTEAPSVRRETEVVCLLY